MDGLDPLWKEWILALRDERFRPAEGGAPLARWARFAVTRGEAAVASEQFERALEAAPADPEVLTEFAEHLSRAGRNPDRAAKLFLQALRVLEAADPPDGARIAAVEKSLERVDPDRRAVARLQAELADRSLAVVDRYLAEGSSSWPPTSPGASPRNSTSRDALALRDGARKASRSPRSGAAPTTAGPRRWTGGLRLPPLRESIAADMGSTGPAPSPTPPSASTGCVGGLLPGGGGPRPDGSGPSPGLFGP